MLSLALLGLGALANAGHVSVPVSRQGFSNHHVRALHKRQDTEPLSLEALNNITGGGYYSEFDIGSPGQTISFLLDTGSSDTWVNSVEADLCSDEDLQALNGYCQTQFDPEDSDTFETVGEGDFDITYLDGRNIQGDYFQDTVTIGDIELTEQILGLALESVRPTGIMGLGFSANVAADSEYPTVVDNMVEQGHIETRAFSLYLNDLDTDAGNILFGGIDREKFQGSLAILDLLSESMSQTNDITSFNVRIDGFDVVDDSGDRVVDMPNLDSQAILDSGSTISLLPDDQVQELWDEFGVIAFQDVIAPFVDCAYRGEQGNGYIFEFRFDGKTIRVPIDEMVIDAYGDIQDLFQQDPMLGDLFDGWDGVCMFGIGSTADFGINTNQFTLLGATFLRSAYVVYDLENEQLGLAQANLNSTNSDIVEIEDGIPDDIQGVESQSPSPTSSAASTTETASATDGSTSTADAPPTSTQSGLADETAGSEQDDDNLGGRMAPSVLGAGLVSVLGAMMLL